MRAASRLLLRSAQQLEHDAFLASRRPCAATSWAGQPQPHYPQSQRLPAALAEPLPRCLSSLGASASSRSFLTSLVGGSMPSKKYSQRRLVGYSPEQMFNVVSQVDEYYRFVPWCQKSRVLRRHGAGYMEAELEVGFQLFVERYTSKVTLVNPPDSRAPKVVRSSVSNSSLFDHLDSTWSMEPGPTPQSCWLSFDVDFAFRSPIYSHVAEMFFSEVVKRMASAFDARCGVRYGPSSLVRLPPPAAAGSRRG